MRIAGVRTLVKRPETRRKDCHDPKLAGYPSGSKRATKTYGIFSRPPHALNYTQVIECDGSEQHLGRIGVAELEDEGSPWLVIIPNMGIDQDIEVVLDVEETGCNGGGDEPDDERSRHRRIRKGHVDYGAFRTELDAIDAFRQCWKVPVD